MPSVCAGELHVTVSGEKILSCATMVLWYIYLIRNNARCTYRVLKEMILQLILHPLHTLRINAASKQKSACSLFFF